MKYNCDICKFNSNKKSNYNNHIISKKHNILVKYRNDVNNDSQFLINMMNVKDDTSLIKCDICCQEFSHRSSLYRHINKFCKGNNTDDIEYDRYHGDDGVIADLIKKNEELYKEQIVNLKQEINNLKEDRKFLQTTTSNAGAVVKESMSALKFILTNYKNAPLLEPIKNDRLLEYTGDTVTNMNDLINNLFYNYKHKLLDRYIGDIIIKIYKKDDPNEQSIWSSDIQRFNYIIRQLIGKKTNWYTDKKGIAVVDTIINPLLQYIKKILQEYVQDNKLNDKQINNLSKSLIETILNNMMTANLIIVDIDNKILEDNILKYITPYFYLFVPDN